jgi:very-short-patch-repair endonuclease
MRALCDAAGLPNPVLNAVLLGHRRDFHWPGTDLVVETDGWDSHRSRTAFEDDRQRDQQLVVAGYRVVRFTHRQIADEPAGVAATLRRLLASRRPLKESAAPSDGRTILQRPPTADRAR